MRFTTARSCGPRGTGRNFQPVRRLKIAPDAPASRGAPHRSAPFPYLLPFDLERSWPQFPTAATHHSFSFFQLPSPSVLPTSPSPSSASLTIGAPHLSPSFHLKPPELPQAGGAATTIQRRLPRSFSTGATTGRRPVLWTGEAFGAVDRRVHRWFNFNDAHCWNRLMAVLEPALIFATIGTLVCYHRRQFFAFRYNWCFDLLEPA